LKRQVAAARAAAAAAQAREMAANRPRVVVRRRVLQQAVPVADHVLPAGQQGHNVRPQGRVIPQQDNNVRPQGQVILQQGNNVPLQIENGAPLNQPANDGLAVVPIQQLPQIKRHYLKRALEHVTNMEKKLKDDLRLLDSMQERHKRQRTNLRTQHASSRQMMKDGHSRRQLALSTESTRSMHALDAAHAQAHPVASADELEVHNTARMELHSANHRAENSSQVKFDSEFVAMEVDQKAVASAMQRGHKAVQRNFELQGLNAHFELYVPRY